MKKGKPATYPNLPSLHKRVCRDFIFQEVQEVFKGNDSISMVSLPNLNYSLESKILQCYKKSSLTLIEHNKETFEKIDLYWAGNPRTRVFFGDFHKLSESTAKFNIIWADMCSWITERVISTFQSMMQNQRKGVFACTILSGREQKSGEILSKHGGRDLEDFRERIFPKLITKNTNYKLVKMYKYKSEMNIHSVPMITYVFSTK